MTQKGLLLNSSQTIDSLFYTYAPQSNKLIKVDDAAPNSPLGGSGGLDFTDNNTTGNDYAYDSTGSLTFDKNKGHTIAYNKFNLPWKITIPGKGEITYIYDAAGRKLEKRTHILKDSTRNNVEITATTAYISGYIYQDNKLSFFGHEEGRIRKTTDSGQQTTGFVYDYFLKDHLGNIRTVLTDEQKEDTYPAATMELAHQQTDTTLYSNISNTRSDKPPGYPVDTAYTKPNNKVSKLDGTNNKIGPGITLKVMAGDKFNIRVSSWYRTNGANPGTPTNPITDLLTLLANGVSNAATTVHNTATVANLQSSGVLTPGMTDFLNNQTTTTGKPKAYLNWVVLDEHFKLVSESSSFEEVGDNDELKIHTKTDLTISKSGYLYVYVSNVTGNIPVYFDNLQVTHIKGPLTEENHYYPFGLQMKEICSKAACGVENKYLFTGKEKEDDFNLEQYDFGARQYDMQTGVWHNIDPLAESSRRWSPYNYCFNNPLRYIDPDGMKAVPLDASYFESAPPPPNDHGLDNFDAWMQSEINSLGNGGSGGGSKLTEGGKIVQALQMLGFGGGNVQLQPLMDEFISLVKQGRAREGINLILDAFPKSFNLDRSRWVIKIEDEKTKEKFGKDAFLTIDLSYNNSPVYGETFVPLCKINDVVNCRELSTFLEFISGLFHEQTHVKTYAGVDGFPKIHDNEPREKEREFIAFYEQLRSSPLNNSDLRRTNLQMFNRGNLYQGIGDAYRYGYESMYNDILKLAASLNITIK